MLVAGLARHRQKPQHSGATSSTAAAQHDRSRAHVITAAASAAEPQWRWIVSGSQRLSGRLLVKSNTSAATTQCRQPQLEQPKQPKQQPESAEHKSAARVAHVAVAAVRSLHKHGGGVQCGAGPQPTVQRQ